MTTRVHRAVFTHAEKRIKFYNDEIHAEPWKRDHEDAMACLAFEGILGLGIEAFDHLVRLDETIRLHVMRESCPLEPEAHFAYVRSLFEAWLRPCDRVENELQRLLARGYVVQGAAEFRSRCEEARWMLKDACDVLNGDAFVAARDRAVDDIHAGQVLRGDGHE